METHVKVLGVLNMVIGALGVCGALLAMIAFGISAGAVVFDGDADAAFVLPILGLTGMATVIAILIVALPGIIVGWGLYRFRPWARVGGIVLAVLSLIFFPFGTILGVYGLWVLLTKSTEPLFAGA
jgi:hypothetical protein